MRKEAPEAAVCNFRDPAKYYHSTSPCVTAREVGCAGAYDCYRGSPAAWGRRRSDPLALRSGDAPRADCGGPRLIAGDDDGLRGARPPGMQQRGVSARREVAEHFTIRASHTPRHPRCRRRESPPATPPPLYPRCQAHRPKSGQAPHAESPTARVLDGSRSAPLSNGRPYSPTSPSGARDEYLSRRRDSDSCGMSLSESSPGSAIMPALS